MFRESVSVHAREDREPYILKFDLDQILILALLRPAALVAIMRVTRLHAALRAAASPRPPAPPEPERQPGSKGEKSTLLGLGAGACH